MNVFLCCLQSPNRWAIPSYNYWRENFKPSLEALGWDVIEPKGLDLAEPIARSRDSAWYRHGRPRLGEALYEAVKSAHEKAGVDLFFSYFFSSHVHPDVLVAIRDLGIPVVNFFCDNMRQFESVRPLVRAVTLNWVPEVEALPAYRALRAPAIHLPMAVNARFYGFQDGGELPQVSFIGSGDHLRMKLLAPVVSTGLPLRIFGLGWGQEPAEREAGAGDQNADELRHPPALSFWQRRCLSMAQHMDRLVRFGPPGEWRYFTARRLKARLSPVFRGVVCPPLGHEEFVRVMSRSAVTLGINRCPHPAYPFDRPMVYSRLRDLEAPLTGACYLTEHSPDIGELFAVGEELLTYLDSADLIEKTYMLLADRALRQRLRENGRRAVLARHTWEHRFRVLFRELGLR